MLNNTNKTQRKENKMKQYALVKIGENEPTSELRMGYRENAVKEADLYETPEQLKEAFDEAVEFGPICDFEYSNDFNCNFYDSVNYYAVEFEGEENPDEEYFIDFASGYLDEYIDELDEENKPKGDFKILFNSEENPGFTNFKEIFDRKKSIITDQRSNMRLNFIKRTICLMSR
jgi:hypothetical protein